ncbi:MAG: hypothetical protein ABDH21_03275 [bacterium]
MLSRICYFVRKYNIDILLLYSILVLIFFVPIKDKVIGCVDTFNQFLPLRIFYSNCLKSGDFPLWYPYQGLGLPFLGILQASGLYPINIILFKFFDPYWAYNLGIYIHFIMVQFFGFLYANYVYRKIGLDRLYSFLSGFLFGLTGIVISHCDFVPFQNSVVYLPLSLLFLHLIIDEWGKYRGTKYGKIRLFIWFMGLSISLGYQLLAGYPQAFVYTLILLFLFTLLMNFRFILVLISAMVFNLPLTFIFLYEAWTLLNGSIRDYIRFEIYNQGGFPLYGLLNQVLPFIYGGSVNNPDYYGPLTGTIPMEFFFYISFFALPLTVFAYIKIFSNPKLRREMAIYCILGIVCFVLAMGKYNLILHHIMFDLPVYSKMRLAARHFMEICFVQSLVIPIGIYFILSGYTQLIRFIKVAFFTYLFIILVSIGFLINPEISSKISKLSIKSYDLYFPLVLGLLFICSLLVYYFQRYVRFVKVNKTQIILVLVIIFFAESLFVFYNLYPSYTNNGWAKKENIRKYLEYISKLDKQYRVCYFTGFSVLFPGVAGQRMLNHYDPIIPFSLIEFFNIWTNGFFVYPYDYFYILTNAIISKLSVKYIFINKDFRNKYNNFIDVGSLKLVNLESLRRETKRLTFSNFENLARLSKNLQFDSNNQTIKLLTGSKLTVRFSSNLYNRVVMVCFKANVSRMSFWYRYRRLAFELTDGLGIEIRDSKDKRIGYYFLNDYYLPNVGFKTFCIPFICGTDNYDDLKGLYVNIYPIDSYGRRYEIKDLEVYIFPMKVPAYDLVANKEFMGRAYLYDSRFMDYDLYINPQALPLIFVPEKIHFAKGIDEIKYGILTLKYGMRDVVVMDSERYMFKGRRLSKPSIKMLKDSWNYVEFYYKNDGEGVVVFNDLYYRGWKAKFNGKEVKIFRANGLVKGLLLGRGEGVVRVYYEPFPKVLLWLNILFIFGYLFLWVTLFLRLRSVEPNSLQSSY